jgi:hypothetical protein
MGPHQVVRVPSAAQARSKASAVSPGSRKVRGLGEGAAEGHHPEAHLQGALGRDVPESARLAELLGATIVGVQGRAWALRWLHRCDAGSSGVLGAPLRHGGCDCRAPGGVPAVHGLGP